MIARLRQRDIPAHRLASDGEEDALRTLVATTRERGYGVRAPDFGGDYHRPRAETDDGRSSIAMPVRVDDRVVAAINLTWRRQVLSLTGMVQRHLVDLQGAVRAVEERARAAGFDGTG